MANVTRVETGAVRIRTEFKKTDGWVSGEQSTKPSQCANAFWMAVHWSWIVLWNCGVKGPAGEWNHGVEGTAGEWTLLVKIRLERG